MATIYRDYGALYGQEMPNNTFTINPRRQVYQVTHEGENSLPFMNRSFISFSFGGKNIEEFNLIATTPGDSLNRTGYASFDDTVSSYDNLEGQQYWSTHYKTNELEFTLVSDGIDQHDLDEFLRWFRAGNTQELILAEHPNRGILARVAQTPQLNLLPFEEKVQVKISGYDYETSTTLYKGEIILNLIMDSPHWYAIQNILGKKRDNRYVDYWDDITVTPTREVSVFASKDALKILYEDGIPLGSMIQSNMLLGNGSYANVEDNVSQKIWDPSYETNIPNTSGLNGGGACIDGTLNGITYVGVIAGAIINSDGTGIESLESGDKAYFYYSGTAPAPTIISFSFIPTINGSYYIANPANQYAKRSGKPYNVLTIESVNKQELWFTTPNVFTSYNKVISLFNSYVKSNTSVTSWEGLREIIREEVRHPHVRAWANKIINELPASAETNDSEVCTTLKANMQDFLIANGKSEMEPVTFVFNSETGEATGTFKYRLVSSASTLTEVTEDVGDMLRSNYIVLRDRNYPTSQGVITAWTSSHKEYSHRITHNVTVPLNNLSILYKNMYL